MSRKCNEHFDELEDTSNERQYSLREIIHITENRNTFFLPFLVPVLLLFITYTRKVAVYTILNLLNYLKSFPPIFSKSAIIVGSMLTHWYGVFHFHKIGFQKYGTQFNQNKRVCENSLKLSKKKTVPRHKELL